MPESQAGMSSACYDPEKKKTKVHLPRVSASTSGPFVCPDHPL